MFVLTISGRRRRNKKQYQDKTENHEQEPGTNVGQTKKQRFGDEKEPRSHLIQFSLLPESRCNHLPQHTSFPLPSSTCHGALTKTGLM
jgi:hypothetical protein